MLVAVAGNSCGPPFWPPALAAVVACLVLPAAVLGGCGKTGVYDKLGDGGCLDAKNKYVYPRA